MRFVIPLDPPRINATYKVSRLGIFYKSKDVKLWEKQVSFLIGSQGDWWVDNSEYYQVNITFSKFRLDVDAPIKVILDVLSKKLGFDDKRIVKVTIEKVKSKDSFVWVDLEGAGVRNV